ncbi:MAG: GNAT family N-acetyltransferase [Pseudomonadota bacterium]
MRENVDVLPATPERWDDLTEIFTGRGDPGKCWCAYWYLSAKDFKAGWGNHQAVLEDRVRDGVEPGVIAYLEGDPAAWASVAPRTEFDRLVRNKQALAVVDDRPVWSLNCLVVRRDFRGRGLMRPLIRGAVAFAVAKGAPCVEAYPVDYNGKPLVWDLYRGTIPALTDVGFVEVARRSPRQPIFRYWP